MPNLPTFILFLEPNPILPLPQWGTVPKIDTLYPVVGQIKRLPILLIFGGI